MALPSRRDPPTPSARAAPRRDALRRGDGRRGGRAPRGPRRAPGAGLGVPGSRLRAPGSVATSPSPGSEAPSGRIGPPPPEDVGEARGLTVHVSGSPEATRSLEPEARSPAPPPGGGPGGSHLYAGLAALHLVPEELAHGAAPERKAAQLERSADVARKRGTLIGRLERADERAISGWAYAWDEPGAEVLVEVHADGRFRGTAAAPTPRPRPDAAGTDPADPRAARGFTLATPEDLLDGDKHWVEAFALRPGSDARRALDGSPLAFGGAGLPEGEVQWADERIVYGWAVDPADRDAPVAVEIVADGETVARIATAGPARNAEVFERARALSPPASSAVEGDDLEALAAVRAGSYRRRYLQPSLEGQPEAHPEVAGDRITVFSREGAGTSVFTAVKFRKIGPGAHAFLYEAPAAAPLRASFVQALVARADGSLRREARRSPLAPGEDARNRLPRGAVSFVNDVQVSGWAFDPDALPRPAQVDVFIDGDYSGRLVADRRFEALPSSTGLPGPDYAFIFTPPARYLDGSAHAIQVFAVNEPPGVNPELHGSPVFFAGRRNSPPIGYFDGLSPDAAWGWAYDPDAGPAPIDVEVWIDDRLHARARADAIRPDLVPIVAAEPAHGFHVPMPEALRDGKHHTVRVFAVNHPEGPERELAWSPREINAQRPWLGVAVEGAAPGLRVARVEPGSPAAGAGVRAGDVILAWDGIEGTGDVEAFVAWARTKEPGERVLLRLFRAETAGDDPLGAGEHVLVVTVGSRDGEI